MIGYPQSRYFQCGAFMSVKSKTTRIGQQFIAAAAMLVASVAPSVAGDLNPGLVSEVEYMAFLKANMAAKPARDAAGKKFAEALQRGVLATGETCVVVYKDIKKGDQQIAIPQFFNKETAVLGAKTLPPMHPDVWPNIECDPVRANALYNKAMNPKPPGQ